MSLQWAVLLLAVGLASGASLGGDYEPITVDYHENYGIPQLERIRQMEQAMDFDGSRIVGGSNANAGAHPFLGGLLVILADGRQSVCGSSLVTNTRAVTAAHCWISGNRPSHSLTIVFGSNRLFTGGTRLTTSNVATHASYTAHNLHNDIAVITHPWVSYSTNVNRILLPPGANTYAGQWAVAAGYGGGGPNAPITQQQPKRHANMQVVTNQVCQQTFGPAVVIASTICARGQNNASICPGDSGGPLAIGSGNNRQLIGVSSFVSSRGCHLGLPAGFARVTSFRAWIQARI